MLKAGFARLDGIVITKDPHYVPSDDMSIAMTTGETFEAVSPYDNEMVYPEKHKGEMASVEETLTLSLNK